MKTILLAFVLLVTALNVSAQTKKSTVLTPPNALSEDSTQLHKIIPAEIPQPILDSLLKRNFGIPDVFTAHRNGSKTVYVIEIAHDLVREIFWFDPRGHRLRPNGEKGNN
jgi:hypothetical protein